MKKFSWSLCLWRYGEQEREWNPLELATPAIDESADPPSPHQGSVSVCECVRVCVRGEGKNESLYIRI